MIYQCTVCLKRFETIKHKHSSTCKECQHEVDRATFELLPDMSFDQFEDYLKRTGGNDE